MADIRLKCFSCGTELTFVGSVSRRDECAKCRADVRVCKNCRFYDPKVYNECRETQADVIQIKDRSNMCDFFQVGSGAGGDTSREAMLKAAEALFKKN